MKRAADAPKTADITASQAIAAWAQDSAESVRPHVSVVTPARGAAGTLARTVASVERQALGNWEHILVTHPEDEQTGAVAARLAARDRRLSHVVFPAGTAAAARNAGLEHARGDYVLFLDADDTIRRSHLERLVREAQASSAQLTLSGHRRLDAEGRVMQRRTIARGTVPQDVIDAGPPAAMHAMLFRRDLLVRIGGFDATLATNEDWDLVRRAAAAGARIEGCTACSADYWTSPGSLSADPAAMMRDRAEVLQRAGNTSAEDPLESAARAQADALRTALWTGSGAVARGGDHRAATDSLAASGPFMPLPLDAEEGAAALLDGLSVGFACAPARIERHLKDRWPALRSFLSGVAEAIGDPGFDRALLAALERELARLGPAGRRRTIGESQVVPGLDHLLSPIRADSDVRQVIVRLPLVRPRRFGTIPFAPQVAEGRTTLSLTFVRLAGWLGERPHGSGSRTIVLRDKAVRGLALARRLLRGRPVEPEPEGREDLEGAGDWEGVFSTENPWGYHRTYEQAKYERTLALLPAGPIGRALELACAEGHFTTMLAPMVTRLTASDISPTALERCRQRCEAEGLFNLDYRVLDFFDNDFGSGWDLIVSSEVLYYMGSADRLHRYAARVVEALKEGGLFLHAHAYQVSDTPERSGFDWGDQFAAGTISRCFTECPDLRREAAVETELYRIEMYRKVTGGGGPAVAAEPRVLTMRHELDPALAADVVWNGPIVTRIAAEVERHYRLPVLMYHAIADEGPEGLASWRTSPEEFEHQLRFLRRRGYRSVTLEEWDHARARGGALSGRPILLTFDDGLEDFAETAWPILQRNGFGALMFAVSGAVGGVADWDSAFGPPRRLMDWDTLKRLADEGLEIGSHCHRHRPLDRLSATEILHDVQLSRRTFEERLGFAPTAVAPPYGICRSEHAELLRQGGFTRVFMTDGGHAPVVGPRLRTPRIEIEGGIGIDAFADLVAAAEAPVPADLP